MTLAWTAPGDDWLCGDAGRLPGLVANGPIEHPTDGTRSSRTALTPPGEPDSLTLTRPRLGGANHAAVLYRDEAGNWGLVWRASPMPGRANPRRGAGPADAGARRRRRLRRPGRRRWRRAPPGRCANAIAGTAGDDKLGGTEAGDRIAGHGGADRIDGGRGDDCARARAAPTASTVAPATTSLSGGVATTGSPAAPATT